MSILITALKLKESNEIPLEMFKCVIPTTDLSATDENERNALMLACEKKLDELALELIKHGDKFDLGHIDRFRQTALLISLYEGLHDVALELIKTKKSKPDQIDHNDTNALVLACEQNMEEVALALIDAGVNIYHIVGDVEWGVFDAMFYAKENEMTRVIERLKEKDTERKYTTIMAINRQTPRLPSDPTKHIVEYSKPENFGGRKTKKQVKSAKRKQKKYMSRKQKK